MNEIILGFTEDDSIEEQYRLVIRNEIDKFQKLFKQWMTLLEKMIVKMNGDCFDGIV